jgi:hypothetical protein
MSGSFNARGELDATKPRIISCLGRKGSGKSIMARLLFDGYPRDRLVIDVAGDDGPNGPDVETIHGSADELPRRWPEHLRKDDRRMTLRYVPDPASRTYLEDMDAAVAMAWAHRDCAILVHEMGELAPSNRTPPATRRMLQMSRHNGITLIACAPRPITMDPKVLMQSDLVYVFDLPNPNDRKAVADNIGRKPDEIDQGVAALKPHEYLMYDANQAPPENEHDDDLRLVHWPPLPPDVVASIKARA